MGTREITLRALGGCPPVDLCRSKVSRSDDMSFLPDDSSDADEGNEAERPKKRKRSWLDVAYKGKITVGSNLSFIFG